MSGDPQIDAEIKKLTGLSIWSRGKLLSITPDVVFLSGLKPQTQAMITQDMEVNQAAADFQAFLAEVLDTTGQTLREFRHYGTPFPTLADWRGKATGLLLSQLRGLVEELNVDVQRITEAITMLTASVNEDTKQRVLNRSESIAFKRGNQSWGIHIYGQNEWENYEKETLEKIQILGVGVSFFEKLITIFQAAIHERESHRSEIIHRIESARKLCTEAEKLIPKIRETEATVVASYFTDRKAAAKFVKGWQKFDALRAEFGALRGSGIEFSDFGHPQPAFPDFSALVFTEADVQRKARIFKIVEDMKKQV